MAELFKAKTLGYGIWTYRDYGDNKVYNSQFALAQQGWKFSGGSKVEEHNGSRMAVLPVSGWISQDIHNRSAGMEENNLYVSFCWKEKETAGSWCRQEDRSRLYLQAVRRP